MKKILILVLTLYSTFVFALEPKDPVAACNRINDYTYRSACLTAVTSNVTNHLAAAACDRIESGRLTMACLVLIAGRTYSDYQVLNCNGYQYARPTISCLNESGSSMSLETEDQMSKE